ncbi:phosphonate ABC transporter ATP-binding protein [Mesorhizobium sp. B4-1-4]|uniref:phosphonate ABC transporter ATP-binding protein n=1 Tax=Mesorhizobium sp. B4-1-4 TaxID=2589888 RepID=UPI00112B09EF|nr:phosphonate ABC transporter ATP-binding protein [Mesorhizobium sp. B4-1-4]UCI32021.1 phosphonate ABC transporter ATP-binding protein [Mesorhizobium sp. B4-1-4]
MSAGPDTSRNFAIRLRSVSHQYPNGRQALSNVSCSFTQRNITALVGPSGSGKSTLLRLLNGMVRASSGEVWVGSLELRLSGERELRQLRRNIGIISQQFNLVKRLSAIENVLLGRLGFNSWPRTVVGAHRREDVGLAMHLLDRVGLSTQAKQRCDTLSGGQQQRIAIARALAQRPKIMLADEPISSLDPSSSQRVMELLREINDVDNIPVIVNLHSIQVVKDYAHRVVGIRDGSIVFDRPTAELTAELVDSLYGPSASDDGPALVSASPVF